MRRLIYDKETVTSLYPEETSSLRTRTLTQASSPRQKPLSNYDPQLQGDDDATGGKFMNAVGAEWYLTSKSRDWSCMQSIKIWLIEYEYINFIHAGRPRNIQSSKILPMKTQQFLLYLNFRCWYFKIIGPESGNNKLYPQGSHVYLLIAEKFTLDSSVILNQTFFQIITVLSKRFNKFSWKTNRLFFFGLFSSEWGECIYWLSQKMKIMFHVLPTRT